MKAWPNAEAGPDGSFPSSRPSTTDCRPPWDCRIRRSRPFRTPRKPAASCTQDVFQLEWIAACKGQRNGVVNGTSSKTHCDFDYAGTMIEQMLLGLVAHQVGKKLEYDGANGKVTNSAEANQLLKREYRSGWKLDG